jgi:hypothetical protein
LEQYLQHIISLPLEDTSDICEFLSTGILDTTNHQPSGQKEGYLTKRGKNFGGWKTRYFVLNDYTLDYYESVSYSLFCAWMINNKEILERRKSTWFDSINKRSDWPTDAWLDTCSRRIQ